jgi:protein disulfide-isomerase
VPADQGGVTRSGWLEDYDRAVQQAKDSRRPVLINFTGSDWCGYCMALHEEVFDTGVFATWAKHHVVLLECDFPRTRRLEAAQVRQNNELAMRFDIHQVPTIVVISAQGEELARSGYDSGGAQAWINDIQDQLAHRGGR